MHGQNHIKLYKLFHKLDYFDYATKKNMHEVCGELAKKGMQVQNTCTLVRFSFIYQNLRFPLLPPPPPTFEKLNFTL